MDLFKIERFGTEDLDKETIEDQELKFKQLIEKRKRERKKKKKRKRSDDNGVTVKTNVEEPVVEPVDIQIGDEMNPVQKDVEMISESCEKVVDEEETITINEDRLLEECDETTSFPILNKHQHLVKTKVKRNLPKWLDEPNFLKTDDFPVDEINYLSENMVGNLKKIQVQKLFPVQASVIPFVLEIYRKRKRCYPCRDVCVQSPTGSGKTLSYVVPIVEILSKHIVRELQCLVILPSKELALQVKQTFDQCVAGTNLKIGLIAGLKSFRKEQESLITSRRGKFYSLVDILICSPGRLVDHLKFTEGFELCKLKFLVIDEADRLLSENYDNWLELFNKSIQPVNTQPLFPLNAARFNKPIPHVNKFLFSATLTEDPEKLAPVQLFNPVLFLSPTQSCEDETDPGDMNRRKYMLPETLVEKMLVVEAYQKPIALLHLMLSFDYKCVLCFTNTIESTHRLFLLLDQFDGVNVSEFSSQMKESRRKAVLRDFREGKLNILIATDAMSRGMDIKNVDLVVNYDAPFNTKAYIHRIGRTARGGESGEAITILVEKEVYHFKNMHRSFSTSQAIKNIGFTQQELSQYEDQFETALSQMKTKLQSEKKKH